MVEIFLFLLLVGSIAVVLLLVRPLKFTLSATMVNVAVTLELGLDIFGRRCSRQWRLPLAAPAFFGTPRPSLKFSWGVFDNALKAFSLLDRGSRRLSRRMVISEFHLECVIGLADAAQTALWTGRVAQLLSWWITDRVAPRACRAPHFSVRPAWEGWVVNGNFTSIIELRPSDIILAAVAEISHFKGGRSLGKSITRSRIGASH